MTEQPNTTPAPAAAQAPASNTQAPAAAPAAGGPPASTQGTAPATGATALTAPPQQGAGDAGKGGEQAKTGQEPAGDITLKLPDGWKAGKEVEDFKAWAKDSKLTGEQAQKVFDLHVAAQQRQLQELADHHAQQQREWTEALQADRDFGGARYEQNRVLAQRAFAQFGSPELEKFLNETGLGNNPHLVRWAWKVGQALAEDNPSATGKSAQQPGNGADPQGHLRAMYPNSPQMWGGPAPVKPSAPTK